MRRRPPRSTRTDTLFPYTTLFRSQSAFALVRTDEGIGQAIGLEEEVRLAPGATARFQAFESDRIFTFTVDERGWEWGTDEIAEAEIRRIAAIPDHRELFLDSDQDQPIPHGGKKIGRAHV